MKSWVKRSCSLLLLLMAAFSACCLPVSASWAQSGGQWRWYTGSGYATGWRQIGGDWYYFDGSGVMQTGWQQVDGVWYYLENSGRMKTGWALIDGSWYYLQPSGAMKTGWLELDGVWYFLNGGGAMKTGWVSSGGRWYYMESSGAMATGWRELDGSRYYFYEIGAMAAGESVVEGVVYQFGADGALLSGEPESGYGAMAEDLLREINLIRQKEGLSVLRLSDELMNAAQTRAKEQAQMEGISHKRPDGSEWYTVLSEHGVRAAGSGENLAMNYTSVESVVKAWLESPTHRSNIVNASYRMMGLGYYEADGDVYWVQLFASA